MTYSRRNTFGDVHFHFGLFSLISGAFLFCGKLSEELSRTIVHLVFGAMFTHLDSARIQVQSTYISDKITLQNVE